MFEKFSRYFDRSIEFLISSIFILMVIVGGFQVINRFFLNQSLSWSEEFQKFSHIWLIFLTIPVAYNRGAHIGMKVFFNKFSPFIRKVLQVFFDILWIVLGVAILYNTVLIMNVAKNQISAGLGIRMDFIYLGMLIGAIYLLFVAGCKLFIHIKLLLDSEKEPC